MSLAQFVKRLSGKWIAIAGNRWISVQTAQQVEQITKTLISAGCKIITGGAEGVDHAVLRGCLRYHIPTGNLKVFLPYTIQKQFKHYKKLEGVEKAHLLFETLIKIQQLNSQAIQENKHPFPNYRKAADARNRRIEKLANGAIIFKPKGSKGTQDALKYFKIKRLPYIVY